MYFGLVNEGRMRNARMEEEVGVRLCLSEKQIGFLSGAALWERGFLQNTAGSLVQAESLWMSLAGLTAPPLRAPAFLEASLPNALVSGWFCLCLV